MRVKVVAVGLALMFLAVTMSGCFSSKDTNKDDGVIPDPNYTGNETTPPAIQSPVIPPCALQPGEVTWPPWESASAPEGPVTATVKRDAYGVPHIYADDAYSLFYTNGYVQAQDRFFEMDLLRHVGWGNSASVVGASQLSSDFGVHRELYTHEEVEAQWQAAPAEAKSILEAFSDGVNRYLAEATARDELPGEFAALGHTPEPWTPQDSVASVIYLIGYFGIDGGHELGNLQRLATLNQTIAHGPTEWKAFEDMSWLRITDSYTTIPAQDKVINGCEDTLPREEAAHQLASMQASLDAVVLGGDPEGTVGLRPPLFQDTPYALAGEKKGRGLFEGFRWGSNAFLLDASASETGKPIMWGAPQMGYYKPPVPYQVGLHGAGFDAVGMGVASAPGIVIGRNADIAWTATSGIEDNVDFVELKLVGDRSYEWDGETRQMACHTVTHETAPAPADLAAFPDVAPPQTYEQEVCKAGEMNVVAINEEAGYAWAKRWTTKHEELVGAFIWLGLARATSAAEFHDMVGEFPFTFNFHVADEKDVYYIHTGNIPIRADGYDPRLPTPAGSAYEWKAEVYTEGMGTWAKNPSTGYFANWNNGPAYGWRAGDMRDLWGPVHRVQALDRTIQSYLQDGPMSFDDVASANWESATVDSLVAPFMPYLFEAAEAANVSTADDAAQALRDWQAAGYPWRDDNGDGLYDDPAHAIWDRMMAQLLALQEDELGDHNHELELDPRAAGDPHAGDHGPHANPLATMLKALQGTSLHNWCSDGPYDNVPTDYDPCFSPMRTAMGQVLESLQEEMGEDVSKWLEPIHYSAFTAMGAFNADERPMVNRGSWVQVVAMGEGVEGAVSALPPSNIGRINSQEVGLWVATGNEPSRLTLELDMYWRGEYKPFALTQTEVDAIAQETFTLTILPPP